MAISRAALYCRLSKDDMVQGDSESIKTQNGYFVLFVEIKHD